MKALTLWQPHATLVAEGLKRFETRSWAPPRGLIGNFIAIHAAMRLDSDDAQADARAFLGAEFEFPLGVVVCTARVLFAGKVVSERVDAHWGQAMEVEIADLSTGSRETVVVDGFGDFSIGRWIWRLDQKSRVDPPIPARGRQGLWDWQP